MLMHVSLVVLFESVLVGSGLRARALTRTSKSDLLWIKCGANLYTPHIETAEINFFRSDFVKHFLFSFIWSASAAPTPTTSTQG